MKAWIVRMMLPIVGRIGPELVAGLLGYLNPQDLAEQIKPHLERLMDQMPREWRRSFVLALRRLAEIAAACVPDLK
jgi:DNA-binding IclR family transcriptional regulator